MGYPRAHQLRQCKGFQYMARRQRDLEQVEVKRRAKMFGVSHKLGISLLLVTLIAMSLGIACIGDSNNDGDGTDSTTSPTPTPNGTETPPLKEITIGNLTDFTGVASTAM